MEMFPVPSVTRTNRKALIIYTSEGDGASSVRVRTDRLANKDEDRTNRHFYSNACSLVSIAKVNAI